jgi:hypothetical protein
MDQVGVLVLKGIECGGTINAYVACRQGKATKGNQAGGREVGHELKPNALDPQFAKPTHVHPPCPIPRPFTLYIQMGVCAFGDGGSGGAESSTWDHDLPCACAAVTPK